MVAALLTSVPALAGCTSDTPELPDQLRVRDERLPGLSMYLEVTEDADGRFHMRTVAMNEGEETYLITSSTRPQEVFERSPWTSVVRRAAGSYHAAPGMFIHNDAIPLETLEFAPGEWKELQATWPNEGAAPDSGTYLWRIAFTVQVENGADNQDLELTVPIWYQGPDPPSEPDHNATET